MTSQQPIPKLAQVLTQPAQFYAALEPQAPQPWRYAGLVVVTGLVSGAAAALTARSTVQAQSALNVPGLSAAATYGSLVFSGVFLMLVCWLLLWFLGNLGAGARGRAAETYGATFAPQLLWSLLLLALGFVVQPHVTVPAPDLHGLDSQHLALALQKYNQAVAAQVSETPLLKFSNYLGYAVYLWQLALAYLGFKAFTGEARRAAQGVAYPAALFMVLGVVFWLLNQALGKMLG